MIVNLFERKQSAFYFRIIREKQCDDNSMKYNERMKYNHIQS